MGLLKKSLFKLQLAEWCVVDKSFPLMIPCPAGFVDGWCGVARGVVDWEEKGPPRLEKEKSVSVL